jgi:hypothetical protein
VNKALVAISAIVLLAAVGTGVVATSRTVRDPQNPAYAGNAISSSTTAQILRDPDNPYWSGATLQSTAGGGSATSGLK